MKALFLNIRLSLIGLLMPAPVKFTISKDFFNHLLVSCGLESIFRKGVDLNLTHSILLRLKADILEGAAPESGTNYILSLDRSDLEILLSFIKHCKSNIEEIAVSPAITQNDYTRKAGGEAFVIHTEHIDHIEKLLA